MEMQLMSVGFIMVEIWEILGISVGCFSFSMNNYERWFESFQMWSLYCTWKWADMFIRGLYSTYSSLLTPRCHTRWQWCTDGGNTTALKCFQFGRFQWESVRFSTFEARLLDYNGYRVNCLHSCCLVIFWHRVKVKPVASSQLLQDWHLAGFSFPVCGLQCNTLPRLWNEETYSERWWYNNKRMQCHKGNIDSHWFDCKPKAVYHADRNSFCFRTGNC